jgi:hypothetical protein
VQVNHRFVVAGDAGSFDALVDELAKGRRRQEVPRHGVLCRIERTVGLPGAEASARRQERS